MNNRLRFGLLILVVILSLAVGFDKPTLSPDQILSLVNADRKNHGLDALTMSPTLNLAAMAKAEDMVNKDYFSHIAPNGTYPWYWFKSLGYNYTYAGENLAEGFTNPQDLEASWMKSPDHRANILSPFYSDVGLAVVPVNNTELVVQFFGSEDNKVTLRQ